VRILSIWTFDPQAKQPPTQADMEKMGALIGEMQRNGILIDTGGAMPGALELRYARKNGKDTVTDGPFTEAKEVVGGFALMEVPDREKAIEWTRRFLDVAGDGTCELHEVSVVD
jgi:hypothetical protein